MNDVEHNDFKCFFGLHKYEIYKEEVIIDIAHNVVGKIIITKCINCGKLKSFRITTIQTEDKLIFK